MPWLNILYILITGVSLGLIIGKIVLEKPDYLKIINPRIWIYNIKDNDLRHWILKFLIGILFACLTYIIISLLLELTTPFLGPIMTEDNIFTQVAGVSPILLYASITILPVFEEWIFRCVLLEEISKWRNSKWWGLILSSIIFAVFHLSNPGTLHVAIIPLFAGGILLGTCYLASGLMPAILAHIIYNVLPFFLANLF